MVVQPLRRLLVRAHLRLQLHQLRLICSLQRRMLLRLCVNAVGRSLQRAAAASERAKLKSGRGGAVGGGSSSSRRPATRGVTASARGLARTW